MSMSNYLENAVNDHIFGKATLTAPTIYVALSSTAIAEDGTGGTEPTGNGYARIATTAADWSAAVTNGTGKAETVSLNDLSFAAATGDWVAGANLAYSGLYDAVTGGNMLYAGAVATPRSVLSGDTAKFLAGQIIARLD